LSRGGREVLGGVSLSVRMGEIVAVAGPNGAGKSTLLGCLSGALVPSAGTVRIDGDVPHHLDPATLARRRAVLDQSPGAEVAFPVADLVALGIPREIPTDMARGIVAGALAALGLARDARRPVTALSGGERHRAHMARVIAQLMAGRALGGGRWLLLDEPTASLDFAHQVAVLRAAREAAAGGGVLIVLHDLTLAARVADRIVLMRSGRVEADGPPREVLTAARLSQLYGHPVALAEGPDGAPAVIPVIGQHSKGDSQCLSQ